MLTTHASEATSLQERSSDEAHSKDISSGLDPVIYPKLKSHSPVSSTALSRVVTATDESILFTNTASLESQNTSTSTQAQIQQIPNDITEFEELSHEMQSSNLYPHDHTAQEDGSPHFQLYNYQENEEHGEQDDEEHGVNQKLLAAANDDDEDQEEREKIQEISEFQNSLGEFTQKSMNRGLNTSENGSYIQDDNSENVLLNNVVRRRNSTRRGTSVEQSEPPALNRGRGSVMTVNSKRPSIDAATIEIERMRSAVVNKREKKKQQQITTTIDDEMVLVGSKVSEGHVNYVVAYNMLTGIRVSVSRCSGPLHPLADHDFKESKKLVFDVNGNELTPSSKYDFKFKDYAPKVFRELRLLFGLDPADYLVSLTEKYILSELTSPGKSGSFFYYSRDYRFIIKTIHPAEYRQLRKILKEYYHHVKKNPNTLISQFYGLHRVKMPLYYGKRRKIYFIVMNNLFPPHRDIHAKFDLKGSTLGRITVPRPNKDSIFKDLNWIEERKIIRLGPEKINVFVNQLEKDVKLLIKLNIMDYSFLIGFHDLKKGNSDGQLNQKKLSVFRPISSNYNDLRTTQLKAINPLDDLPPAAEFHYKNFFYSEEGGLVATDESNQPTDQIMYFGIIDCLTDYSIIKRLETFWRSLTNERKTISAVPPNEYGARFLEFIESSLNENTIGQKKSKSD